MIASLPALVPPVYRFEAFLLLAASLVLLPADAQCYIFSPFLFCPGQWEVSPCCSPATSLTRYLLVCLSSRLLKTTSGLFIG